jgi:hypothetical protein
LQSIMDFFLEIKNLTAALDAAGVDYALCGGVALAIHGVPRATQDIDLLVRPEDLASRQTTEIEGGRMNVVSREDLISLKLAAGRPQDLVDVQRLQETRRG